MSSRRAPCRCASFSSPLTSAELRVPNSFVLITLLVCASAGDVFAEKPATPNYTMAVWASEKGLPRGDVFAIAQDLEGYLWVGWAHGSSSLRRQSLLAVAARRSCVGATKRSGARDRRIARRQHLGRSRRWRRRRSHSARPDRQVLDRRRRAARRVRDDPGSTGSDLGCGSSRVVQVRQQSLDAGRKERRATTAPSVVPYEDRAGHLWVGTASGIYKKTKDVFELVDPSSRTSRA